LSTPFFSFFQFFSKREENGLYFQGLDRQTAHPGGECSLCGALLYDWESVYVLDGDLVCTDCLEDYAKDYFAQNLWVLEEWNGRMYNDHE
jgi:hypothetical protein